jgi:Icc-related predicted phosphoesterase
MRVMVLAHLNGRLDALERAVEGVEEERADAILVLGSLLGPDAEPAQTFATAFRMLTRSGLPSFVVPGEADAPERAYLAASLGHESVGKGTTRSVHGSFALAPSHQYAVAGFGGRITDDKRDHERILRYPGWELLARLDVLRDVDQIPLLAFHHPPAEAGDVDLDAAGSHTGHLAVTEAITTWRARFAACAGERPAHSHVGRTLLVSPGRLDDGDYAMVDVRKLDVLHRRLPEGAAA